MREAVIEILRNATLYGLFVHTVWSAGLAFAILTIVIRFNGSKIAGFIGSATLLIGISWPLIYALFLVFNWLKTLGIVPAS